MRRPIKDHNGEIVGTIELIPDIEEEIKYLPMVLSAGVVLEKGKREIIDVFLYPQEACRQKEIK